MCDISYIPWRPTAVDDNGGVYDAVILGRDQSGYSSQRSANEEMLIHENRRLQSLLSRLHGILRKAVDDDDGDTAAQAKTRHEYIIRGGLR